MLYWARLAMIYVLSGPYMWAHVVDEEFGQSVHFPFLFSRDPDHQLLINFFFKQQSYVASFFFFNKKKESIFSRQVTNVRLFYFRQREMTLFTCL